METTLHDQDRLFMTDLLYTPKQGDIVIVDNKAAWTYNQSNNLVKGPGLSSEKRLIKRVIATGGQELNIDPKVVRFRFKADNPMASVILANSITLTPGTVTMNVTDDGVYEIHALTVGAAAGVLDGGMQKKVADLYGEKFDFAVVESEE